MFMRRLNLWSDPGEYKQRASSPYVRWNRRYLAHILALCLLFVTIWFEFGMAHATTLDHTMPTVQNNCGHVYFSNDGNPFPLCPSPYPGGGNCVWWAWEQWHLLGYDLPLNWGNAADWIVDAERFGLPVGTTPRLGSIAVFPRADGVWAYGTAGHVAFVTWVSPDQTSFNVTYQNYGDPTPMYIGHGYNVSVINQARYQNGELRFIYFPGTIDQNRFAHLGGVDGNGVAQVAGANSQAFTTVESLSHLSLGLPPGSYDQEFNADFTGSGFTDLLLYNRQQGSLDVLTFTDSQHQVLPNRAHYYAQTNPVFTATIPVRVKLGDAITHVNGWGSSLDIRIGDFTGIGHAEILLYDRVTGQIQLLSLTPQLTIQKHVVMPGWGAGWELYAGQFDGQQSDLFMYRRVVLLPIPTPTPVAPTPIPSPRATSRPTPKPTPKPTHTPTPTPTPRPTPSPTPTHSPTPGPTGTPNSNVADSSISYAGIFDPGVPLQKPAPGGDLNGDPTDPRTLTLLPNVMLVSFSHNFSVHKQAPYTLLQDFWEVYVGRFVNAHQDGLFLYDRQTGEARIMDFTKALLVNHYQAIYNLDGNWEVHSGDFTGAGRAQLLLYDPGSGHIQILAFAPDLSLARQVSIDDFKAGRVLYVGHFGLPTLSIMLYDQPAGKSTFVAFSPALKVAKQFSVTSWNQNWQILIGSFLDRSACLATHSCTTGDDILVLNRSTGRIYQFVFTFGNQYKVYDNRSQSFLREGATSQPALTTVNASSIDLLTTLDTGITNQELY